MTVTGASCQVGPSPTSRAQRLEGLRAESPDALGRLVAELPSGAWDVALEPTDPVVGWLSQSGFVRYGELARHVAPLTSVAAAPHVSGVLLTPYRNAYADAFQVAERFALEECVAFQEIGQPSGYEGAEGFDAFVVARRGEHIVGFAQAQLPEGWVNWMGVIPPERRRGIGRALVDAVARLLREHRGTHIGAEVDADGPAPAFWRAIGAPERGRSVLLISRGGT